ncbi:hypothetical protein [Aquipuribacter sp. MA13-6]|uniref:hypothetical protein n=1 Tax=unclassified Aquipuribacter TaxID=2635084 RepID=UPI003EE8A19C
MLPTPRDTSEEVAQEAARVVSRLSTLTPARIPVDVVRPAVQRLADAARAAEGLDPHPVPDLAPHGWVDLLRVVVGDLLDASPGEAGLVAARDELVELRRALP